MISSLSMYDLPQIRPAVDRYWQAIRARLGTGPERLTRDRDLWEVWQSPDLLLGQTCSLPFRTRLSGRVALVGTPDYGVPECPPGYYCSVFVARADDADTLTGYDGRRLAYNETGSQSGWAGPMAHLRGLGIRPSETIATGAHARSAHAVAEGSADLAGLDAVTWALLSDHDPVAASLRVIGRTALAPGLPYICAIGLNPEPIAAAVRGAIDDLAPEDRDTLHLRGLVDIPEDIYRAMPRPDA